MLGMQPSAMCCDSRVRAEGVRHSLAQDVERAVEVGLDAASVAGLEQPAFQPLAELLVVMFDRLAVE